MDVSVNFIGWNCIIVRESDFRWGFQKYSLITSEFCYASSYTTASQQIWFHMISCVFQSWMPNVCFEYEILKAPMIFRCDDNLALFSQHLIDMHSE